MVLRVYDMRRERSENDSSGGSESHPSESQLLDDEVRRAAFTPSVAGKVLPFDRLRELERGGFASVYLTRDGKLGYSTIGKPLKLADCHVYSASKSGWQMPHGTEQCFLFSNDAGGGAVIPVVGGAFFSNGRRLADDEVERLGFKRIKTGDGQPMAFPAFIGGGRKIFVLGDFELHIEPTEAGGFMLPDASQTMGGRRLSGKPVIAVDLKGFGGEYQSHLVLKPDAPAEVRFVGQDATQEVVDRGLVGERGMFPDLNYNGQFPRPVGMASVKERLAMERDRMLAAAGAILSGFTLDCVELLDREQFPGLVIPRAGGTMRVILDDLRRFGTIIRDPAVLMAFQEERYDVLGKEGADLHLGDVSSAMGANARVLSDCGLGYPHNQNSAQNLSAMAGIIDTSDLCDLRNPGNVSVVLFHYLIDLERASMASGYWAHEFYGTEHFRVFAEEFAGKEAAQDIIPDVRKYAEVLDPKNRGLRVAGGYSLLFSDPVRFRFPNLPEQAQDVRLQAVGRLADAWLESRGHSTEDSPWKMSAERLLDSIDADPTRIGDDYSPEIMADLRKQDLRPNGPIRYQSGDIQYTAYGFIDHLRGLYELHTRFFTAPSVESNIREQYERYMGGM